MAEMKRPPDVLEPEYILSIHGNGFGILSCKEKNGLYELDITAKQEDGTVRIITVRWDGSAKTFPSSLCEAAADVNSPDRHMKERLAKLCGNIGVAYGNIQLRKAKEKDREDRSRLFSPEMSVKRRRAELEQIAFSEIVQTQVFTQELLVAQKYGRESEEWKEFNRRLTENIMKRADELEKEQKQQRG